MRYEDSFTVDFEHSLVYLLHSSHSQFEVNIYRYIKDMAYHLISYFSLQEYP